VWFHDIAHVVDKLGNRWPDVAGAHADDHGFRCAIGGIGLGDTLGDSILLRAWSLRASLLAWVCHGVFCEVLMLIIVYAGANLI